jgi:hypothetical protein
MSRLARWSFVALLSLLAAFTLGIAATAARAEQRVALVIGNAAYAAGAIKTAANDAGLVAQTLESAGFEVMGARDRPGRGPASIPRFPRQGRELGIG